jgi:hypothetical protein
MYCTYNVTLRSVRVHVTTVAVEKQQVLHILSVCVYVTLVIQYAERMRRIILSSVVLSGCIVFFHIIS